ncbi:MAG TPA: hypothetical protein VIQ51_14860 [Chryseosolibacter sp.]|jgi:hypothetical protein
MNRILRLVTISIATLAIIGCAGGWLLPGLYRDPAFYKAAWRSNDLITLILAPALLIVFYHYQKGNMKANVLWLGLVLYMFYNYAFYLFGAVFNSFFILYAAICTLSLYGIIVGLFDIRERLVISSTPVKRIVLSGFLFLTAIPLAIVELGQYVNFILYGTDPEIPKLVLALDLTLVVPNTLLAAVLLLRKHRWAYTLTGMMLVKSFTYGLVLVTGTIYIGATGAGKWDPLLPYYIFVSAGGLIFLLILLKDKTSGSVS